MSGDGWSKEYHDWIRLYLLRLDEERLQREMVEYLAKFRKDASVSSGDSARG